MNPNADRSMKPLRLRLPATSANLGPGFDALGLAMCLFLGLEAALSSEFQIEASGRNPDQVASLEGNLILETYRDLLVNAPPLCLRIHNEIPLGMGCGSSAAALLAGVLLANHFGALGLSAQQVLEEACRREGHPDNVAACFYGGLTASAMDEGGVRAGVFAPASPWRLFLALPPRSLATSEARALLPTHYTRADTVQNIQATALLLAAFALDRSELLLPGTRDRIHQPYRMAACPLLARLLPLAGTPGIYSVTLSGAGPSVLLICDPGFSADSIRAVVWEAAGDSGVEILQTAILNPRDAPAHWPLWYEEQVT